MAPNSPASYIDDLRLAHLLADDADSLTMSRFRAQDLRVKSKPDNTPVSDADTAVEESVRRTLRRARPRDAVVGEELGATGWGPRRWVVDPIDGTKNYVRGVPVWATLIALMVEAEPVVGVVSAPALGRRWWAAKGEGAFAGRSLRAAQPCHVSAVSALEDASLSYSSLSGWADQGTLGPFSRLLQRCWRTRGFGDFWSYMLVAEGAVDIACEPELELHDMAALAVIVEEAGGLFTSLDGTPGPCGGSALATNNLLHDEVLELIGTDGAGAPGTDTRPPATGTPNPTPPPAEGAATPGPPPVGRVPHGEGTVPPDRQGPRAHGGPVPPPDRSPAP